MPETAWQRRVRRMLFLLGGAGSMYLFFSYLVNRMREARVRALKERRERETIKAHFTSLLSTISFTLYALLPNLEPQLFAAYPVEATSQALQDKANPPAPAPEAFQPAPADGESIGRLGSPTDTGTTEATPSSTPADSLLLEREGEELEDIPHAPLRSVHSNEVGPVAGYSTDQNPGGSAVVVPQAPSHAPGTMADSVASMATTTDYSDTTLPAESWASEFTRQSGSEDSDDILTSSTISQSISLPPTDTSSVAPSPQSEFSRLEESPTRAAPEQAAAPADPRSKKELWRDLKVQSLTRAFATAYLVPLVYLLTSSQLTILARSRYLAEVKAANAAKEEKALVRQRMNTGLFSYFSVDAMGLGEYADGRSGPSLLPSFVKSWFAAPISAVAETPEALAAREAEEEMHRAEAERLFLTYSWWLLNEGWRSVSSRVEHAVDKVFGTMGLKRELSAESWDALVKEVRAQVETELDEHHKAHLFDFSPLILPPTPCPQADECPLPERPEAVPDVGAYLAQLLKQTRDHTSSPDARLLVDRGVAAMTASLTECLREGGDGRPRRLANLLPELNRWSRGVWEGIPDGGVETLLALPDFEAFAALIFGDWAPRA